MNRLNRTWTTIVLALGTAAGLAVSPASAQDWSVALSVPDQTVGPGATATYSGTITNSTGGSLLIDAAIDFIVSPETNDFTIEFSSELAALGLVIPTTGFTGPLFQVTWGPGVTAGMTGLGSFELGTTDPATPSVLTATFTLRTPGVGPFCAQRVGQMASSTSIASHDSSVISPRVAWHDPVTGTVGFAGLSGGAWVGATVASGVTGNAAPSLLLDSDFKPHIAYYNGGLGDLVHAYNTTGSWVLETVDATGTVGAAPSLVIDVFGDLHVAYHDVANGDLKYARKSGAVWSVTTVDTTGDVGSNSSIAVDDAGQPTISYYDATNQNLRLATRSGSIWTTAAVDTTGAVGSWSSVQVRDGQTSIAYRDATAGAERLQFATGSGGPWSIETVDAAGNPGIGSRLALNGFGEPRIAYFEVATQRVLYAVKAGPTWTIGEVDGGATGSIGLARTETDEPILSYTVTAGSGLRYASPGICAPLSVDAAVLQAPRLVLHPNWPNPFTRETLISFTVREASAMRIRIFDAAGRVVAEPLRKTVAPGTHRVEWNGVGNSHQPLPAGLYVYEVRSGSDVRRGRMVLLR